MTKENERPTALDLPMVDPLPLATQKYFDLCTEKLGLVPNVLQAYAFDIDKLNAFAAMYNDLMLADSGLSKLEREMIAEKLTKASAEVEEPDRQALRDLGFSDRDIWDIAAVTGFYNMSNRIASGTGMHPNDSYHAAHR